jgi:hypothetical protein
MNEPPVPPLKLSANWAPVSAEELGKRLGSMYHNAARGDAVVMIHLFGIQYAEQIKTCQAAVKDIVAAAGISDSYVIEVHKGIKLAKYVRPRQPNE